MSKLNQNSTILGGTLLAIVGVTFFFTNISGLPTGPCNPCSESSITTMGNITTMGDISSNIPGVHLWVEDWGGGKKSILTNSNGNVVRTMVIEDSNGNHRVIDREIAH